MSNYVDTITVGGTDYPVNIPNGVKFRNPTSITPETNPVIRKNDLAQSLSSSQNVPPSSNAVKTVTDALSSDLTANQIGTYVDLSSYTESSPYTFPYDGYVYALAFHTAGNYLYAEIKGSNVTSNVVALSVYCADASKAAAQSVWVKKGMKTYVGNTSGDSYIVYRFYPVV